MVIESSTKKDVKMSGKLRKEKLQAPPSKIVIRKLPPTFSEDDFKNAISPIPENNYFSFVPADKSFGQHSFSRAYINFLNPDEILSFRDRFDGYVFVDQKGNEYPALVEYAPFQKVPKNNHHKKDIRCGTIDEDPDYLAFLDLIQNPEAVNLPQIETLLEEIETAERESRANGGILKIKTPLLEYVEQRNAERFRPGDRKRRKEFDRKKIREEEKRRRKDYIKEYRKRDEYYPTREEREKERAKRKEEEKLKWKEKREEKEKLRKERVERYKTDEREKGKDATTETKPDTEEPTPKETPSKDDKSKTPQRTKRYSEVRKKEEKEKKHKEEKNKVNVSREEKEPENITATEDVVVESPPSVVEKSIEICEEEKDMKQECKEELTEEALPQAKDEKDENRKYENQETEDALEEEEDVKFEKEEDEYEEKDEKAGKDPRTERRIRNKDRPAMQLYRPGQARLKTRLKPNEEGGNEGESSSSSASPILGVSEEKERETEKENEKEKEKEKEIEDRNEQDYRTGKDYIARGGYDRKYSKYKEARGYNYYWDEKDAGHNKYRESYEGSSRGGRGAGTRRGYSYHQERESKGKWVGRSRESDSSQFKSMTFRRSTSQE